MTEENPITPLEARRAEVAGFGTKYADPSTLLPSQAQGAEFSP